VLFLNIDQPKGGTTFDLCFVQPTLDRYGIGELALPMLPLE